MVYAYSLMVRRDEAQKVPAELESMVRERYVPSVLFAFGVRYCRGW